MAEEFANVPTHVGVNRGSGGAGWRDAKCPHARGGEPGERRCRVEGCERQAVYAAHTYAFQATLPEPRLTFLPDPDCPYLCAECAVENVRFAVGNHYRHTHRGGGEGITIYLPLTPPAA